MQPGEARKIALSLQSQLQLALSIQTGDPSEKPQQLRVAVGSIEQAMFDVKLEGIQNKTVIWYVNDIAGGDNTFGIITSEGLYTPPQSLPENPNIQLKVTPEIAPSFSATFDIELIEKVGNQTPIDISKPTSTASLEGGTFSTAQSVMLNCTDAESGCAAIYFTLDGSEPSITSTIYSTTISIDNGTTVLKFFSVDNAGNLGFVTTQTYVVLPTTEIDITPPVITLNGNSSITLIQGRLYLEEGASATDDIDGKISVAISGTVDTNILNTYTITYTATDAANNSSTVIRTVDVINGKPFITTWKTDNPGASGDNQITIRTSGSGYFYTVNWGDGQTDRSVLGDITHTYAVAGTYTVAISGDFPRIVFYSGLTEDPGKILSIEQWGSIQWRSMNKAFNRCINLVGNASDAPDLSRVTDMSQMFESASTFNQDLSSWDVSSVTSMNFMFRYARAFNGDLSNWDVSSVTHMSFMFGGTDAFNQDLSSWDVSSVIDMVRMFQDALAFNGDLSSWVVSSVTDMSGMFYRASSFNQDLSSWDVSSVTDMNRMFYRSVSRYLSPQT